MTEPPLLTVPPERGLFCNRTLNLRAIAAIGYDMDYTLVHYRIDAWERRAYEYLQQKLLDLGWPVGDLEFQPNFVIRGLIIDTELGNIVKANRFGYIKLAYHGTRRLPFDEQRGSYTRTLVDLREPRWVFLNTFFSLSEACMYAQLVDRLDEHRFPEVLGYAGLYKAVRQALDAAHAEGRLKGEILQDPDRYVELDPEVPQALLDQKEAGKRLLLITNSEWDYTLQMMRYAFDRFLPGDMTWRDLFELVIVSSRKPYFFSTQNPLFEVVSPDGLLRPLVGKPQSGGAYLGGSAGLVEHYLGLSGAEILYVGDHLYTDVQVTKDVLRWRTALMVRELERELVDLMAFRPQQRQLDALMTSKEALEFEYSQIRLSLQRIHHGHTEGIPPRAELEAHLAQLRARLLQLDEQISPLARAFGRLFNDTWGLLMRTGRDKSHLARQVERYADIYTSRVSNFLYQTPFVYLRSPQGSLPHDPNDVVGWDGRDV